ncbi:MAG: hypothetical protein MJ252_18680 [archaeon]|nr:hypothetical protein [archaeon]
MYADQSRRIKSGTKPSVIIQTQPGTLRSGNNPLGRSEVIYPRINTENRKSADTRIRDKTKYFKEVDKDELYKKTVRIQHSNNKLRLLLAEAKSSLVQSELNLKKKEKMIDELKTENKTAQEKRENKEKGRESTLTSQVQKNYKELKQGFRKLEEENQMLKSSLTVAKRKEFKIDTEDILKEMIKLKKMYKECSEKNNESKERIDELQEIKKKFFIQHKVIESLKEDSETSQKEMRDMSDQIQILRERIAKKEEELKKQKIMNKKLEISNNAFLEDKKTTEKYNMSYYEYMTKLEETEENAKKADEEYRSLEGERNSLSKKLKELKKELQVPNSPTTEEFKREAKARQIEMNEKSKIKAELHRALLRDQDIKVKNYENYLLQNGEDPEQILKDGGYKTKEEEEKEEEEKKKKEEEEKKE